MLLFGNFQIEAIVAIGIVLFFGMGLHEYAHAVVADGWSDPTPREMGRLTPNPIVHINWVGWLMFLFIGFGILGSVPINPSRMRDGRWGSFWTSFAGPISNLIQAALFALGLRLVTLVTDAIVIVNDLTFVTQASLADKVVLFQGTMPQVVSGEVSSLWYFIALLFYFGVVFNVLLFVFNLLPLFPIDGWRMVLAMLPGTGIARNDIPDPIRKNARPLANFMASPAYTWQQWAQITQYAFFGLLLVSFAIPQLNVFGLLIGQPMFAISRFLLGAF